LLNLIAPNCKIVQVDGITEGAACTTLLAKEFIDNDQPLVMANSDQFVEWDSNNVMYSFQADGIDGGILSFKATHPKWSYAKLDENGFVSEVAEKKPISDNATVGVYYWKKGSDYVKYAEQMIDKNIRTNNEFYVAPVFNEAIGDGKKIRIKEISKMWGIGTPEDLNYFLENHK
jgi:dTDP-glucose pyrophosphorylase